MILTITPNPLLDYVIHEKHEPKKSEHRVEAINYTVGGKGINVARMLKTLGKPPLALTFSGGANGEKIKSKLESQGIFGQFVETDAETRTGINYIVENPHKHTWWLEKGLELSDVEIASMIELVTSNICKTSYIAMSGSIPGINNTDFYARVLDSLEDFNGEIYIDATAEPLKLACERGGFFLKHNRSEAIESFGLDPFIKSNQHEFVKKLYDFKIWSALITDGENGAVYWDGNGILYFNSTPANVVSSVGCGDATLAGLLYGRANGLNMLDSIKWGLAAGGADVEFSGPCEADFKTIESKLKYYFLIAS